LKNTSNRAVSWGGNEMAGIGRYLKQVREQQGYSLEEMNRLTNIHTEYLNALENDQFDLLPSPFYAKAFLRTYAKCLGLDAQPLLEMYERSVRMGAPVAPEVEPQRSRNQGKGNYQVQVSQSPPSSGMGEEYYPSPQGTAPIRGTFQPMTVPEPVFRGSHGTETEPAPLPQITQRHQTVSSQLQKMQTVSGQTRPSLPNPNFSQPLAPRRALMEAKQTAEKIAKKGKKSAPVAISVAVAALLLIGAGVYMFTGHSSSPMPGSDQKMDQTQDDTSVNAVGITEPVLEPGETSDNEYEGQLYYISNVKNLEVVLKGDEGEARVEYAPNVNDQNKKSFRLQVGQEVKLDTQGKDEIWFRLSYPSNVKVTVNGQELSTDAQDTEKSYRIKVKK
jgi:cytoskeleton protein RodZ